MNHLLSGNVITSDVIIIGTGLAGLITAHLLYRKLGDSVDVLVLEPEDDIQAYTKRQFVEISSNSEAGNQDTRLRRPNQNYIIRLFEELNLTLPDPFLNVIQQPEIHDKEPAKKDVFYYRKTKHLVAPDRFDEFTYCGMFERWELNQYLNLIDMVNKYFYNVTTQAYKDCPTVVWLDTLTAEDHIKMCILTKKARDVMRGMVQIISGITTDQISALFLMLLCAKSGGSRVNFRSRNLRNVERLTGDCREALLRGPFKFVKPSLQLTKHLWRIRKEKNGMISVKEISNPQKEGNNSYECQVLLVGYRPEQTNDIRVDQHLVSKGDCNIIAGMMAAETLKFRIEYSRPFWRKLGFTGSIFSPDSIICWVMEMPSGIPKEGVQRGILVGFVKAHAEPQKSATEISGGSSMSSTRVDQKREVIQLLVEIFGDEAAEPLEYTEEVFQDIFVPAVKDLLAFQDIKRSRRHISAVGVEWSCLDVFSEGDLNATIEHAYNAFISVAYRIRPQSINIEDVLSISHREDLLRVEMGDYTCQVNYRSISLAVACGISLSVVVKLLKITPVKFAWFWFKLKMNSLVPLRWRI